MRSVIVFILFIFSNSLMSYPIFYKCSKNQEIISHITDSEAKRLASKLNKGHCTELTDCINQLKQVAQFAYESQSIANSFFEASVMNIKSMDTKTYDKLWKNRRLYEKINYCHEIQNALSSGHGDETERVKVFYPNKTTYQYIVGHRENDKGTYKGYAPLSKYTLNEIIDESVRVGVDPLAILGMASMERPGKGVSLYWKNMHDSRSQMVLGCSRNPKSTQMAKYTNEFNQVAKDLGMTKGEDQYLCIGRKDDKGHIDDTRGFSTYYEMSEVNKSKPNCCVKTRYNIYREEARKITTYLYFKQMQNLGHYNRMAGKYNQSSITHRLNTFWGASKTTGTYPSYRISPFRVGINTYKDPNYGRQIMDFALNSFRRNGNILRYIADAEKRHGKKAKSFLCVGKPAGAYSIDSDYYLNKIKNTKRLAPIKLAYDKGTKWKDLGIKFQSVLLQEFSYYRGKVDKDSASYSKIKKYLTEDEQKSFKSHASRFYQYRNASLRRGGKKNNPMETTEFITIFQKVYDIYFNKPELYEHRKTLVNAAKEDSKLSWERSNDSDIKGLKEKILKFYQE